MKFSLTKILILISTLLFSQKDYTFIYIDGQNTKKNKIVSTVENIINSSDNIIFYMTDEGSNEVYSNENLIKNELDEFPSYWSSEEENSQLLKINNFFNNSDIFESLKNDDVLEKNIDFHFFFNHFDFFVSSNTTQANKIIDKILLTNNLFSYKNGKRIINKNCKINLYLNYNSKDYFSKESNEEDVRREKKRLEERLKELYNNNYEYQII